MVALVAVSAAPAAADSGSPWRVKLAVNNDFLTNNSISDDFYTFGARLSVTYGRFTIRWEENAFTDRVDGQRFDETYATLGWLLGDGHEEGWNLWLELGATHVGEGLLGQEAQNDVHEAIGDDPVFLDYLEIDDYYAHVQAETSRQWRLTDEWTLGPQVGVSVTPSFRWNALVGLRSIWRPSDSFTLDVTVGGRYAKTDLALLRPHLEETSLAALVELDLPWGFVVEWSLNRYGTDREHVSIGYRFGGGAPARPGAVP